MLDSSVRCTRSGLAVLCAGVIGSVLLWTLPAAAQPQPELASAVAEKSGWVTRNFAVAAANPLATRAGQTILRAGGSAVDAAIAAQMVLTLVEPQSSGIGGGAMLMHWDGRQVQAFDGRETAPAAVTPELFLDANGKPLPFAQAVVGGRSVGVPGTLRMLEMAHRRYGRLPWARLFDPAIALARDGFAVSPRMATLLAGETALRDNPAAASYFYDAQGNPWPAGHWLRNPELAAVLELIAHSGADALMAGPMAQAIVQTVRNHPTAPGAMTLDDLRRYTARVRMPLCFEYHTGANAQRICGMPPPSSGMLAIGQILGMLEYTDVATLPLEDGIPGPRWLHAYNEASLLAFADRALYVADPDFVEAPGGDWNSLLAPNYLQSRGLRIDTRPNARAMTTPPAGVPSVQNSSATRWAPMPEQPEYGTSHLSIADAYGNVLSMTTTIEDGWGARLMVNRGAGLAGGFLLNNELTDFSFLPADVQGRPVANRVEPGKRPRSSMSPTLVFDARTGAWLHSLGSPGGAFIIHFTAKVLAGSLTWGLNAQQAINLPNFAQIGGPLFLESGRFPAATVNALRAQGHTVQELPLPSGLQAIDRTPQGFFGGADPRREGIVLGD
jgi:gamma-glutamyltranspeptidase/glutathione hydrolase